MAFKIKFLTRRVTETPVLIEDALVDDLDEVVERGKERLRELRHVLNPIPSTFVVLDEHGVKVRRWTDPEVR